MDMTMNINKTLAPSQHRKVYWAISQSFERRRVRMSVNFLTSCPVKAAITHTDIIPLVNEYFEEFVHCENTLKINQLSPLLRHPLVF